MKPRAGLVVLVMFAAVGCKRAETETETLVVLDAQPALARDTRTLHVLVTSEPGGKTLLEQTLDARWPYRVALTPEGGDASRNFRLRAEAETSDGRTLGRVQVIAGFVAEQKRYVHVVLEDDCQALVDDCTEDDETCRSGACASAKVSTDALLATAPERPRTQDLKAVDAPAGRSGTPASGISGAGGKRSENTQAGGAGSAGAPTTLTSGGTGGGAGQAGAAPSQPRTAGKSGAMPVAGEAPSPTTGDPQKDCAEPYVTFQRNAPRVWLVIDGSGSMEEAAASSTSTKWQLLRDNLMNREPNVGILSQVQSGIQLGLMLFDGPLPNSDAGVPTDTCVRMLRIEPKFDNLDAIALALPEHAPGGSSPTDKVFEQIRAGLPSTPDPNAAPTFVVLITDGTPNDFCSNTFPLPDVQSRLLDEVGALGRLGVQTYVIALGVGGDMTLLSQLKAIASAGSTNKPLYAVDGTTSGFTQTWVDLVKGLGCSPKLNVRIKAGSECTGKLLFDGAEVPCDAMSGFSLNDESTLQLHGKVCQQYRADPLAMLQAQWPCSAYLGLAKP